MRRSRLVVVAAAAALSVVALVAGPASGQLRDQDLDEVPVAVSTFTAATLRENMASNDVDFRAVGADAGATTSPVRISGVSSRTYSFDATLGEWVEKWALEDAPPLRGPQGELYGRPAVNIRRTGETSYYSTQTVATGYLVEVEPLPEFSSDEIFEISLAYSWFGEQRFANSGFAFDPLVGFSNFVSTAIIGGEPVDSFGRLVEGEWTQFGDPLISFDFTEESGAYFLGFVLPGIPEAAAFTLSYSSELSLDQMIAQQVAFGQPETIEAPGLEATVGDLKPDFQLAYIRFEDTLAPADVATEQPSTTTTQLAQPAPAEEPPTTNDPAATEPAAEMPTSTTIVPTPIDNLVAIEEGGPGGVSAAYFAFGAALLLLLVIILYLSRGLWWPIVGSTLFGRFRPLGEGAASPDSSDEAAPVATAPAEDSADDRVRTLPGSPYPEWGKVWWETDSGMIQIDEDDVAESWVRSRVVVTMAVKADDDDGGSESAYVAAAYTKGEGSQRTRSSTDQQPSRFVYIRRRYSGIARSQKTGNLRRYRLRVGSAKDVPTDSATRDSSLHRTVVEPRIGYMRRRPIRRQPGQELRVYRLNRKMARITDEDGVVHLVEDLDPDAPAMAEKVPIWISDDEQVLILAEDPDSFFDKLFEQPAVVEDFPDAIPTGDDIVPS